MALFYGVFEKGEKPAAFDRLLDFIHEKDDHFDTGVLGGRVIFHVLAQFGYSDLALKMIVGPEYPSYGDWIMQGGTTLWEQFDSDLSRVSSMNHHFWGDISSWFIQYLAGIRMNPTRKNVNSVDIAPCFVSSLDNAEGFHIAPAGKITSSWYRENDKIKLSIDVPEKMTGRIKLPVGFTFDDGHTVKTLGSGEYTIVRK